MLEKRNRTKSKGLARQISIDVTSSIEKQK